MCNLSRSTSEASVVKVNRVSNDFHVPKCHVSGVTFLRRLISQLERLGRLEAKLETHKLIANQTVGYLLMQGYVHFENLGQNGSSCMQYGSLTPMIVGARTHRDMLAKRTFKRVEWEAVGKSKNVMSQSES